jgi:hypothetical protein
MKLPFLDICHCHEKNCVLCLEDLGLFAYVYHMNTLVTGCTVIVRLLLW